MGLFNAGEVISNTSAIVSASYTTGGINLTASNNVTIMNIVLPSPLISFQVVSNQIILSWSTNFVGFGVEYTTDFPITSWKSNSVSPAVVSNQFVISNTITGGNKFFRLKK